MSTLRCFGFVLSAWCGVALFSTVALAAPPAAPTPKSAPAPLSCPSGQACGDHCIPWAEVCSAGLASSLGYAPPSTLPPADAGNAPPGSRLLALPRLQGATAPGMRDGAPPWCVRGGERVAPECIAWYKLGKGEGVESQIAPVQECTQDQKCAGVCLPPGEVCPSVETNQSKRLDPYTPTSKPWEGFH